MTHRSPVTTVACAALLSASFTLSAGVSKDLPYPAGTPSADEIAQQVYFVNHFYAVKNYGITKKDRAITVLVNKAAGETPTTITLERFLNNDYDDGAINAMDLAIFRSGKLRGTGMLITDFTDDNKSQSYAIWLPALRKIRRFAEPAHDDAWGGTDFTFGDVTLRKPSDETHELLGTETFNDCLGAIDGVEVKYLPDPPQPSCEHKGKSVYKLKSTTKRQNWWYDERISYIDTKTFADYRTDYFKGGEKVKVIDRDWGSLGLADQRAQTWKYWYGKTFATGHETWAVIPEEVVEFNQEWEKSMWSEQTLRKIKR
ncbi:MAG: outer membrane lipoprotein-sorting protein [Chromatiaceae bacterium]|nr:outer membrane lipoprotein-sorting protein [Chromatiaceae bacterium]MCP5408823.1 outer membrane lipoprotein-sorting protein [Chromatiaceae bacterium]MCP5445070.1 outer membrane lipoprotein-sorting protein [Chromatiaceae bacterium]